MNQKIIETALAINFLCERYDQATSSTNTCTYRFQKKTMETLSAYN